MIAGTHPQPGLVDDYLARLNLEGNRGVWRENHPKLDYIFRKAARYLRPGAHVAEFGIGDAHMLRRLAAAGMCCTGLDISGYLVEYHRSHQDPAFHFMVADIAEPDGHQLEPQDAVFCLDVLEHIAEVEYRQAIRNLHRLLRPGGVLVGTVPFDEVLERSCAQCPACGHAFHTIGHKQSFDLEKLESSLRSMFSIRELGMVNAPLGKLRWLRTAAKWLRYRCHGLTRGDTCYFIAERI